ncbi:hypothetical protein [Streptomyces mirabilis]|jgi:alkanesulfonate monooxygenase SsuD/methylene tetrahydromethanopterin reductase-like flavin-dependent oxidoreductase (luciferase family)|uniref:Uncharacterized protein n=1 Tax=Streptomyces mirabilis TaxID=68239 RepID=A0A1I2SIH1_9ACTN|nr:hypothetical protein [Streptomyces mirabilis]SFG52510.1 hypothetical protein SAMN02787118_12240 [Streptomyces mirabilis]
MGSVTTATGSVEAAFPGRIDLGIGRAPGGDGVTAHLLRGGRNHDGDHYSEHVEQLAAMVTENGLTSSVTPLARHSKQLPWPIASASTKS